MKKRNIILSVILTVLSVVYTVLVKIVDVRKIGPKNSAVGFAKINKLVSDLVGLHTKVYKITEILGLVIILIAAVYAVLGIYQLIKRKSIKKVDREIIVLGIFYVLVLLVYVVFEKVVINYRPVLIHGELEASYPSSHTMLALCIGISSLIASRRYISDKFIRITDIITILLMLGVFVGRIISGVHWITDIIGGVLISATLIMYFYTAYDVRRRRNQRKRH